LFTTAVKVTFVATDTLLVRMLNVPEVFPSAMVRFEAGLASLDEMESLTGWPPAGAGPLKVTVPTDWMAPLVTGVTEVSERVKSERASGAGVVILRMAVLLELPSMVVNFISDEAITGLVRMSKVAELAPAATGTDMGMVTMLLGSADSKTVRPPSGAGPLRFTVPTALPPPIKVSGETVTENIVRGLVIGLRVSLATPKELFSVALIAKFVTVCTVCVWIENRTKVSPSATLMVSGRETASLRSADRFMVKPPAGAESLKVSMASAKPPPSSEVGSTVNSEIEKGIGGISWSFFRQRTK